MFSEKTPSGPNSLGLNQGNMDDLDRATGLSFLQRLSTDNTSKQSVYPHPPLYFILNILSAFYICCIFSNSLQTRFFNMEANNINPESWEQSDLGPYFLQYRLP